MNTIKLTVNNIPLNVQVAKTKSAMSQGLMNVHTLPDDSGMLFCYPDEQPLSFWMKNTVIPLSIAFIDKHKRITQIEDMSPGDETGTKSNKPAKWALEVNKGWFAKHNIKVGDTVSIPSSRDIKIRVLR